MSSQRIYYGKHYEVLRKGFFPLFPFPPPHPSLPHPRSMPASVPAPRIASCQFTSPNPPFFAHKFPRAFAVSSATATAQCSTGQPTPATRLLCALAWMHLTRIGLVSGFFGRSRFNSIFFCKCFLNSLQWTVCTTSSISRIVPNGNPSTIATVRRVASAWADLPGI